MDIVINQEELKKLIRESIEKKGHFVKNIELYARIKVESDLLRNPRIKTALLNLLNLNETDPPAGFQTNILEYLDFHIICETDI